MKLWAHRGGERRAERRENSFPSPSHNHWTTKIKRLVFSPPPPAGPASGVQTWGAVEVRAGGQRGGWVGGTWVMRWATRAGAERHGSREGRLNHRKILLHLTASPSPCLDPTHPTPLVLHGFTHGWPVHHGRPILWQVVGSGIMYPKDRCHLCFPVVSEGGGCWGRETSIHQTGTHAFVCTVVNLQIFNRS